MVYNSLVRIINEISKPQITLKMVKEKFDEFELVISQVGDSPNQLEAEKSVIIVNKVAERVNIFYKDWKKEVKIVPTDEELEYLEKLLDKLSEWYRGIAKTSVNLRKEEPNIQNKIRKIKSDIVEEKKKREKDLSNDFSTEIEEKLKVIAGKVGSYDISLSEAKKLYEEMIEIVYSNPNPSLSPKESRLAIEVIQRLLTRIIFFYVDWKNTKRIQPANEELNLLEELCDRLSSAYKSLAKNSSFANQENFAQDKIKQIKIAISEKRSKGDSGSQEDIGKDKSQKQIEDLETSIKALESSNKNNDDDKTKEEIDRLKSELQNLKNKDKRESEIKDDKWLERFGKVFGAIFVALLGMLLIIWLAKKIRSK